MIWTEDDMPSVTCRGCLAVARHLSLGSGGLGDRSMGPISKDYY